MGWVVAGLGNPGEEYDATRHNAGRMMIDFFRNSRGFNDWREDKKAKAHVAGGMIGKTAVALVAPDTFMNKSGSAISKFIKSVKAAERLVVVYDDLDLPLGSVKLSFDRGSGGHKGVESIMRAVKTKKFARIRIGVSPSTASGDIRKPQGEKVVVNFILQKFKAHEIAELKQVFKKASDALDVIITEGVGMAMNRFN